VADDWEAFSANPYQPEVASPPPLLEATYSLLLLDWPDQLEVVNALLLGGKRCIWFDLLMAMEIGLSGQDIQDELGYQGIEIHAKALYPIEGILAAIIAVDAEKETRARKALVSMRVVLL